MPNTTKTMAPVSTSGRTAGFPQPVFTQGLKPKVAEMRALGTAGTGRGVRANTECGPRLLRLPLTLAHPQECAPSTFVTRHIEEAFGGPIRAGAEQAPRRCHTQAPVEGGLMRLSKVQLPVEAGRVGNVRGGEARRLLQGPGRVSSPPAQGHTVPRAGV